MIQKVKDTFNKHMPKGGFARNAATIASGTAFAQAIGVAISPVITRLYSPEDYGVLTAYVAILGILGAASSLKYEAGIPISESDEKAINVVAVCVLVLTTFTLLVLVTLAIFGESFLRLFNGEVLYLYRYLIPVGIFFHGLYVILTQWAYRKKDFKAIGQTKFSQSIASGVVKITGGLLSFGPIGLILGAILGQSFGVGTLSRSIRKEDKNILQKINSKEILWSIKRFVRFPVFSASARFLNVLGTQLPIIMMGYLYGIKVVGFYGLANTVLSLPMSLIGVSVGDVFYAEAARIGKSNPRRLKELSIKLVRRLSVIGVPVILLIPLFGIFLFSFVFGSNWNEAGVYAKLLSFLIYTRFVFMPASRIFSVMEKQKHSLVLDFYRVLSVVVVFVVSKFLFLSSYWFVALYSISMIFVYLVTFILAQRVIKSEIIKKGTY